MKLIGDFFYASESKSKEDGFVTTIKFNPAHIIYLGHFPGYPVTPGVIQMQIVNELLESFFGRKLKLVAMPQCKFLKIMNPIETPEIEVSISYKQTDDQLSIYALGKSGTDYFFKIYSVYQNLEL